MSEDSSSADTTRARILQATLTEIEASKKQFSHEKEEHVPQDARAGSVDAPDCCVICLDQLSDKAEAQPCLHSAFDFLCLASWLQKRSSCPLCNAEVTTIHYDVQPGGAFKAYTVTSTTTTAQPTSTASTGYSRPTYRARYGPNRPRREYTHRPTPEPSEALARRRAIYSQHLYSLHVGCNRISRYREFTPVSFAASGHLQSRARKWIRRELSIFSFLSSDSSNSPAVGTKRVNNAEFLLEYVVAILKTLDIQGQPAQDMLADFLGRENARLFLHELRNWLRSPYVNLEDWDRNVQYPAVSETKSTERSEDAEVGSSAPAPEARAARSGRTARGRGGDRYRPYYDRNRRLEGAQWRWNPD